MTFGRTSDDVVARCTCDDFDGIPDDDLVEAAGRVASRSYPSPDSAIVVAPPTSESGSESPKIVSVSDGEEKYECYGEGDRDDYDDVSRASASSTPTASTRHDRSRRKDAPTFQKRTTWLRTSLRRSPSERRRVTSNALASQLYRSSSFNSSGRNSSSGDSDDMHADLSLEDDVMDLNQKVHVLQQQVSALANNQNTTDDRYGRLKQDNAALTAKVHMLEEQLRELEVRSEDRIREEQQRFKDLAARHERERSLDLETYNLKLRTLETENAELREEIFRSRALADRLKQEKAVIQDQLAECEYVLATTREEQRKLQELAKRERDGLMQERAGNARIVEELTSELQALRRFKTDLEYHQRANGHVTMEPPSRLRDLEEQIRLLKEENRSIRDANEELQAQLLNSSIAEGRSLLHYGEGTSLAAEFEAMSKDEVMEALREQRDVNKKLRAYIDGILLNILDSYPSILEVKGSPPCTTK